MRKILLFTLSMLLLTACGNSTKQQPVADEGKEHVIQAVTEMYNAYFNPSEVTYEEGEGELMGLGSMYKYVTDAFNDDFCTCQSKSMGTGMVFLDYDMWINAQDSEGLKLQNVELVDYNDHLAVADVVFENFGAPSLTRLELTYDAEKQSWLVSDFIDPETGSRFTDLMKAFLETPYEE